MPGYRRSTSRRKTRGKSTRKRKRGVVKGYTRRSGYYGRYNKAGSQRQEHKFFDSQLLVPAVVEGSWHNVDSINKIVQGTGEQNRIGRGVNVRKIQMRWIYTLDDLDESHQLRILVVLDTQCNGAAATAAMLFQDHPAAPTTPGITAYNNLANSKRFKILYDKSMNCNKFTGLTDPSIAYKTGSFYKSCFIPLEFSSTTGVITEIKSNNVFVMYYTSVETGGTARLNFYWRLRTTE